MDSPSSLLFDGDNLLLHEQFGVCLRGTTEAEQVPFSVPIFGNHTIVESADDSARKTTACAECQKTLEYSASALRRKRTDRDAPRHGGYNKTPLFPGVAAGAVAHHMYKLCILLAQTHKEP